MYIDIHAHTALNSKLRRFNGMASMVSPDDLLSTYDRYGIERGVLLPCVSPECAFNMQSNEEIIEIARRNNRFIPFCNIDPRAISNSHDADLSHLIRHYKDEGCKGIGEVTANLHILDPKVQNLFKHAAAADLPLTFHLAPTDMGGFYGLVDEPGLPGLEFSLARFPGLKFFGHSQTFWAEISKLSTVGERNEYPNYPVTEEGAVPKLMRKYPNLYGDLSAGSGYNALSRDKEYAIKFLKEFQDRLMFGLDIVCPETETFTPPQLQLSRFLLDLKNEDKVSSDTFYKIAKGNAVKILGL